MQKQSFGGGYGINRKTGGASTLTTAIPAMKGVTVKPGLGGGAHVQPAPKSFPAAGSGKNTRKAN